MPPYNQAKALLSPRARHRWVWLASLLLIACGDGGGELDPPADAGLAGDVSLDVSLDSFADGGLDTSGEDDIAAADDAAAQDVAVAKPDSADDVAKPDASASPDGGPATDVGGMDGGGAGTQDAAQADGAETDAAQGQADGAEQADGGGADGGGADSGGADGAKPAVHIENQGGKLACSFDKYSPPAQAKVTWRWRLNTGAWADGKAVWDKQLKACDLLACTATVETTSAKLTSAPAKTQLPVGALCNTGNSCQAPSCSELGGCAAAGKPGTCEDGDPCTIGDTCTSGTCIAGKKEACVNYYSDQDGDGFGQASLGCLCKAPANAVTQKGDCNDTIKTVYPKAKETCDGLDEDCDGSTDEAACTGMFPPGTADFKPKKPTTGDTYDTEATATFDAGPFGKVTLTGNVKKTAKDKPATWCFAGPAKLSGAPFSLDKVQLKICKDAAGTITRTYAADLTIEGSKSSVSGTFSVGASAGLVMNATALKIMGLSASGVSLSWQKGQGHVSIAKADVTVAYLGQQLKGALTGKWVPNKDTTLAIAFATQTGSKTVGGVVGATSQTLSGSHSRKGGETTTTLALGAKKLTLPGANPDEWAVSAKRQSGKTWKLEIAAKDTTVGPFTNLALSGDFIEGAKTACVTGDTGHKPAGALTNMTVTVCWTDGKATVTYNAQVDAKPTGAAKLSGQWGSGKLCLSADVANAGPASGGAAPKVSVQTCFDPKTKVFSPLTFQTTAVLPNKAAVPMQGVTDPKTGALCLTGAATTQAGSLLPLKGVTFLAVTAKSCMAGQKFSDISINYIYRIGKSGNAAAVVLQTTLHLGEVGGLCKTAAATVDACMTADKKWRAAAANPALRFGGRYAWVGGVCVDQEATTKSQCGAGSSWQHGASFRGITTLAAPCSSSSGSACAAPWKAFFDLPSAAPTALRTAVFGTVTGAAWVHGGKAVLQIGSPVTSALTGGAIVLAASGKTSLISLTKPAVRGRLSADGAWTPNIVGDTSFSLARNSWATLKVIAKVAGTVDPKSPNRLILSGLLLPQSCNAGQTSCTWPTVEPVKASIGAGVFAVDNKAGRLDLSVPFASAKGLDLTAELTNNAAVKLPGNAKVKLESHVFAVWPRNSGTGVLSATPEYNFVAPLPQASIKVGPFTITFGKAMNAKGLIETRPTVLVVSTHGAKGLKLDLDGAAANGKETSWDVPAGATVRSTALIPHMKPFFPNNTATVDLSWVAPAKFKIKGSFKAKVPMIRPEYGVPAIRSLDLTEVFVELTLPSGDIVIGGKAALQVYDRAKKVSHLSGLAQFEMDAPDPKAVPAKPGRVGGTIALNGLWKNPFWIPNFALFNIGLSAKFPAGSSVPTAIGYNGQGLWLKGAMDGKWPKLKANKLNSPVGVKADGSLMTTLPSNVETIGSTVYVDTVPGDSGICAAPGVCAKMPELLLRLDAQNVSPVEMTKRTNFLLAALKKLLAEAKVVRTYDPKTQKATQTKAPWAELAKVIPVNKTLSTPKLGPIPFSLDRFFFYVHTNSMQRFGLDWPFGFRMAADARFKPPAGPDKGKEKKVKLFGDMNLLGATLGGWMSPLQLLPGVKLVGDPFRRHVLLKGGSVQIPVKSESSQWGTFEGWFNGTKYVQGSGGAVLFSRRGGQYSLGVDVTANELAPACVPGAVDINGKKRDCKTPIARVVVTVKTGDSKVKPLQRTRVMKTRFGVLQPGQSHHVAVVRNLKTHIYKVFVDGNEAALLDTANGKDGIPGTKDDLDRFASPTVSAPITMGQKFHHIDDMRLWKSERTQDQLRRGALALPKGFHTDKGLIARWQVDFDRKDDVSNGVMMMRNSRLNAAAAWHGKYLSGAAAVIDPNNQDLYFALNLALNNPAANGWSLRAGLDIKLPKAFRTLSGNPEGIAMAAEIAYAENTLSGKLFMRQLTLVPIPTKGGLVLTGAGPDGQTGTFDDGVLAEAKFTYPSTSGFSGEALPNIDTSLQLAIDWNGKRSPILGSTLRLGCLKADKKAGALFTGKTCTLGSGYHVFTRTTAGKTGGLNVDLGGGLGKLGITGSFELSTLNKPVAMNVQGGVTVFGKKIANALLRLDKSGFKAETDLKLGSLNGVEFGAATKISVAYTWKPARLCASGKTKLAVPALATFDGTLSACFGTNPTASFSGTAKAGTFGGVPLADLAVKLDATKGLHITKAKLKIPNIFDANLSGYYKNAKSFDLTGKSTVLPGKGKLLKFVNTVAMSRSSNAATKLSSAMTVSSPTKWVSSAIKGSLQYAGGQWYWALAGSATLKPFGFKLTSGRFWACNPLSKTAKSNPPECKTTTGFGASATLNLGIAKVKIKGAVALNIKIGTGRYDKVELTGKLTTKFRKVFSFTGTPTLTMTAPIRSGHNQLKLTSKLTAFSVTSTQNLTLKAGTNGLPKSFTLTASGSLKPYAGVTLSGGKAYYKWSGAGSSASATGSLNLSPVVTTKVSAVISTSGAYAFTGTGEVRMANLMKKSTSVTMSSSGVAVNSSMTADTYVADLTGTINGNVPYNKAFSFSSTGKLKLSGFPEASVGNFKAHYTSGVSGTASVNMKIMNMSVTATASPNSTGLTLSGSQSYNWNLGSIPGFSYFVTVTEWFAAAVSGWSCSCGLDIPPCKCTQSQKKYKSKGVSGSVKFTLSGTSYGTSSNVQLKATATLTAGLSATASTTCNMSLNPQCCFSFPSPVGKQCLKLY